MMHGFGNQSWARNFVVDLIGGEQIRFCFFLPFENWHLVCDEMAEFVSLKQGRY